MPSPLRWFMLFGAVALVATACGVEAQYSLTPVRVEVREVDGVYRLFRGGQPYYIKGAGGGASNMAKVAARGGNSIRTWGTRNAAAILDSAQALGLTVTLGLDVARERHGFDYSDSSAVAEQKERIREEILKYRDHPALLVWAIGNELNLNATNPKVWDAVNDISRMIHELDPNHPTTTTLAGINEQLLADVNERAPDLDLLSIQMYAAIVTLPDFLKANPIGRPYLVTYGGATGHWEVEKTPWGAPIEDNSSMKADNYLERYYAAIATDTTHCLGSYVFLWGQKQERTPTWYGLFLESGEETESVDVMQYIWTGTWPENRSPRVVSAELDGKTAYDGIRLKRGNTYPARIVSNDADGDSLSYFWDVKPEATELGEGGDFEPTPESIDGLIETNGLADVSLKTPEEPGAYRLFVYVYDGKGHAAHANIPFFVE